MKVCRFCAEEIQDAAIVCKHCGRELAHPLLVDRSTLSGRDLLVAAPAKKTSVAKLAALVIALLLGGLVAGNLFVDHRRFVDWSARRDLWRARCDAFVGADTTSSSAETRANADACRRDLRALTIEAKAHRWID